MNPNHNVRTRRFVSASLIALLVTFALLFLMTRLILPTQQDRVVTRMIQNIEFHRAAEKPEPTSIEVFELPPIADIELPPTLPGEVVDNPARSPRSEANTAPSADDQHPAREIDWWAEARKLLRNLDEEAFRRWRIEQGRDRYVSIMQGALPITNPVRGGALSVDPVGAEYVNTYGEVERKISDDCVMQMRRPGHDYSDFAKNLPGRVVCKATKPEFSFDMEDFE